ncbi:peptide/nickel transport system ATP-binding protein [Mariprofundus ferrinatatus]|uniref:Peptide/nickel transport system ATP-binding protein n=1 Tax=Mariprofundus ferrinatatus TaxID=1921087 RepID=A0A2K8L3B0_9PROT|nr:ABC transporter ATP-binding protein [Mariprofundus ferrinatatus]ATX81743.1 peptide/nickel transport system ATP-binding protein [Mariprofundus ferrinatatus]
MLDIRNLSLSVSVQGKRVDAVSGVSLQLEAGRVLGLVGESGCGKSLTAQAILRLGEYQGVNKSSGDILINGESLFSMSDERLRRIRGGRIAMVFQEPMTALNPVFSIESQITEVIRLHLDMSKDQARQRAVDLLRDVGMQDAETILKQYPDALSGGMRQRVLIAMAMAADPDYIIADEPTTALDVSVQKRIIALLLNLQKKRGLGLLLVTHDFGLVAEMCDDVAVMYAGQIVEAGPVKEIFDRPAHPYTRALMGCRPEVSGSGGALAVIPGQVPQPGRWPVGCHFAPRCALADAACKATPVNADAWSGNSHVARCIHVENPA